MRKSILWAALLSLVFLAGCHERPREKQQNLHIKTTETTFGRSHPADGGDVFPPDVSHDGRELAIVSTLASDR
jgi:hypothetical protein